jgi:hypothetical protein
MLLFAIAPAYKYTIGSSVYKYSVYKFIFGNSDDGISASAGLIVAFIFVILGILCAAGWFVLDFMKKGSAMVKMLIACFGFLFFLTAGILFFCTLPLAGVSAGSTTFLGVKVEGKIGAGAVFDGIFGLLAGFCLVPAVLDAVLKK